MVTDCGCSSNCNSNNSTSLPVGLTGAPGLTGATGIQGLFGGFSGEWIFNTSTSTGPSSTQLRFNNATYSSITAIYVSDTNANSIDYDGFLDSLNNNSTFGYVRIFKKSDSTKFWCGQITAVTDNGTDHTLAVTYISSNSTFSTSDPVVLTFSPAAPSTPVADSININGLTQNTTSSYVVVAGATTTTLPIGTYLFSSILECTNPATLGASISNDIYSDFFVDGIALGQETIWEILNTSLGGAFIPVQFITLSNSVKVTLTTPVVVDLRIKHVVGQSRALKARLQYLKIA